MIMGYALVNVRAEYLQARDPRDPCSWGLRSSARSFESVAAARQAAIDCDAPGARVVEAVAGGGALYLWARTGSDAALFVSGPHVHVLSSEVQDCAELARLLYLAQQLLK
jgi:hypothetical protein